MSSITVRCTEYKTAVIENKNGYQAIVSTDALNTLILAHINTEGEYTDTEIQDADNQTAYYVPDHVIEMSPAEIKAYVIEHIDNDFENI